MTWAVKPEDTFVVIASDVDISASSQTYVAANPESIKAAIDFHSAFLTPVLKRETGRKIYIAALRRFGIEIKRYPRWPQTGRPCSS